jgi:iron complex transport system permease protein
VIVYFNKDIMASSVDGSAQLRGHAASGGRWRALRRLTTFWVLLLGLILALVVAIIAAVGIGAVPIPFERVVRIVLWKLVPAAVTPDWNATQEQIVWVFRLPRALLAVIVGAALAVSGTVLQAVARNSLADPYIFGVSSGASVGAVAVLTLGSAVVGGFSLAGAAFAGALLATILVYLLAQQRGRATPTRLVLAGVALGYVLSAVTSFLVLRVSGPGSGVATVLYWLAGSLGGAKWEHLGLPSVVVIFTTAYLLLQARPLNALLAGDETATGLGVNVERFRIVLFVLTSLMIGVVVAVSGAIGFVGLMVPHIARLFVGADHRRVLPMVALLGGLLMVLVDLVGRTILAPQELPVGIVTAALGGPFFLWLMRRK